MKSTFWLSCVATALALLAFPAPTVAQEKCGENKVCVFLITNVGQLVFGSDEIEGSRRCSYQGGGLCGTEGGDQPIEYIVYMGPFDTRHEANVDFCDKHLEGPKGVRLTQLRISKFSIDGEWHGVNHISFRCPPPELPDPPANRPPSVRLEHTPEIPIVGQRISITAAASDPDGDALTFAWSLNGQSQSARSTSVGFTPTAPGAYTVSVTVTDEHGASASDRITIDVLDVCTAPNTQAIVPQASGCPDAPEITQIDWPGEMFSGFGVTVRIGFRDDDRDVTGVSIVVTPDDGARETYFGALPGANGLPSGIASFEFSCRTVGQRTALIRLVDAAGNESAPMSVPFRCKERPANKPLLTDAQKAKLKRQLEAADDAKRDTSITLTIFCGLIGLLANAGGVPTFLVCTAGVGGLWWSVDTKVDELQAWLDDPPDPNFTQIDAPRYTPFDMVTPQPGFPQGVADPWNALVTNLRMQSAWIRVLVTAAERAQGAAMAGDTGWERRQAELVAQYAAELAVLMNDEAHLRAQLQGALQTSVLANVHLDADQVRAQLDTLRSQGLPAEMVDVLRQLGLRTSDIAKLQREALSQPPQALSLASFSLAGETLLGSLHESAQSVQNFATDLDPTVPTQTLRPPPDVPQPPHPPGDGAPSITGLGIPGRLRVDVPTEWVLHFADPNGDIAFLQFEQWVDDGWVDGGGGDPQVAGLTQGRLTITTTCKRPETVRARVTLIDAQGNRDVREYQYECVTSTQGPSPGNGLTLAAALDANGNGRLDDAEVRTAVQLWITGQPVPGAGATIDDATMRALIQMWILGQPVAQNAQASAAPASTLAVHALQWHASSDGTRTLHVAGRGVAEVELNVFDLGGRVVLAQRGGPALRLALRGAAGQPLANGVYLYTVAVRGAAGEAWRSGVRRLVVLR